MLETEKESICRELRDITIEIATKDWTRTRCIPDDELNRLNGRSRIGCTVLDRYFFQERLETRGSKGINFFEFVESYDTVYAEKPYIKNLIRFCEENNRYNNSSVGRLWYCYGLCFGRISGFKITNALRIYRQFAPRHVIDPFAGFGGRMAAAMMAQIPYTGFDTNINLRRGYERLYEEFRDTTFAPTTQTVVFRDSNTVDYAALSYDMVLTSPPYDNTEIYSYSFIRTKPEWDEFYNSVFTKSWNGMDAGGTFAINIPHPIYLRVLEPLLGPAGQMIELKKSSRNSYSEMIYIWKK